MVTGAARGLGERVAARLLDDGWSVALLDIRDTVEATARVLAEQHGDRLALGIIADVSDPEDVRARDRARPPAPSGRSTCSSTSPASAVA